MSHFRTDVCPFSKVPANHIDAGFLCVRFGEWFCHVLPSEVHCLSQRVVFLERAELRPILLISHVSNWALEPPLPKATVGRHFSLKLFGQKVGATKP